MSKNITLMGASYTEVPAVQLPQTGGGTALFTDVSDTTAAAADVAEGKYFYTAAGVLTEGTGSGGGGGITTEVIFPEQTVTATTAETGGYSIYIDGTGIVADENYIVTVDSESFLCYAATIYGSVYAGDIEVPWGSSANAIYPFCIGTYPNTRTQWFYKDNTAHTVKIEKVLSFDAAELTTKTITQNGTYNASSDNADGYSSVTVNVSGGSSKNVQVAAGMNRVNTTSYTAVSGQSLEVAVAGTYDVYWTGYRSSTSGTSGTQLYINEAAHGTAQTSFSNNGQSVHLTGVSLAKNDVVAVYARARSNQYYMYAGNLTIVQTS